MFIVPLLLTGAVGYWVLERAEHEKGRVRTIGRIVAGLILILSLAGLICKGYWMTTGKSLPGAFCPMGKRGGCPMLGGAASGQPSK